MSQAVPRLTQRARARASAPGRLHHGLGNLVVGQSTSNPRRGPTSSTSSLLLWNSQIRRFSRLEFHSPSPRRLERPNLLPSLVLLGTAGVLGYYLYGLYAKTQMWPPDVRSDLRAAIKARRVGEIDTAGVYYKRALEKCLGYDDIHAALGVKHRLMVAGIAIALGGAYEDAAEAARRNHSSIPSSSPFASTPPYQLLSSQNRDLFKRAYDAYEIAFVVLAEGELDEHVWEHILRAKNRLALRRLTTRLATASARPQSSQSILIPDSVQRETYYRLIQVSSHLSHLAGVLSGTDDAKMEESAQGDKHQQSYEELEALHALFALASLQQGRPSRHGHTLGLPRAESVSPGRFPEVNRASASAQSNSASSPSASGQEEGLAPIDLMQSLDAHGPRRLDYVCLLERAADVFARQGATRQALHLYRSAADALVPALTGEPESWATIGLGEGTLPARETCQVATLVNNMANVCAGAAPQSVSPQHRRADSDTTSEDNSGSRGAKALAAARASQPQPDVHRARRLAQAAARLIEVVSESNESKMSRLRADKSGTTLRPATRNSIHECELARLVVAFNIGVLSEMLDEKVPAREAYEDTRVLAEVTLRENDDDELRAGAKEAEREASDALERLDVTSIKVM